MNRLKVATIVGTRPELIKLSRVIAELDRQTKHVLTHTNQSYDYELNEVFFSQLDIRRPDHFLDAAADTAAQTIGNVITRSDAMLADEAPDALLILGDTNSCLSAIAAKRRRIPVFHMEAGNRSFDERVPEEINRRIVDHISDINMPYTEHARRNLLAEGIRPETIIKTGSPLTEVLAYFRTAIESSDILDRLDLQPQSYFIASLHREENVDDVGNLEEILDSLEAVARRYDRPMVVSTHPRTRKRLDALHRKRQLDSRVRLMKPFGFLDYVRLQQSAICVLSDSGSITEEASILNLPAVMLRETHERPEGMDEATVVMSGLQKERVLQAVEIVASHAADDGRSFRVVSDYEPVNVSKKVVRVIASYVDYVNRTVWRKRD